MIAAFWTMVLVAALFWPGHGIGLLDGIPLDGRLEAALLGALVPALWWLDPGFSRHRTVQAAVLALVVLKIADQTLLTQQGWCARFETAPLVENGSTLQRSWDVRADWRSAAPQCSAIVERPYISFTRFPVWFLNLQDTRPPNVPVRVTIDGFIEPRRPGSLTVDVEGTPGLRATIGSLTSTAAGGRALSVDVPAGLTAVRFEGEFAGSQWKFVPQWNGDDVFHAIATTRSQPRTADRYLGGWLPLGVTVLASGLIAAWLCSAVLQLSPTLPITAWVIAASVVGAVAGTVDFARTGRFAVALLAGALLLPVPERLRNVRGLFLLVGVPWLVVLVAGCFAHVGRITMYSVGDDWTTFQRFAHRIYIEGYWLEGGERTFWQQPLYRWIAGALHMIFGDSSAGEMYLDAAALLAGALFAGEVARRIAGFRAGLAASLLTLMTNAFGPNWYIVGRGLSDAVAAGFLYIAASMMLDTREPTPLRAVFAGCLATCAFLTRLNYLPLIVLLVALMLPVTTGARSLLHVRTLWRQLPKRAAVWYLVCIAAGVMAVMLRTWHYIGEFSLFAGTTRLHNATGLGLTLESLWSWPAWRRALESVLMIVTVQDPPTLNVRAVLVIAGVSCALLGLFRVPLVDRLPLGPVLFCVAALSGGLVARGVAYPGRFSLQLIPIAVALSISASAMVLRMRYQS
jgi:hypothetical protein